MSYESLSVGPDATAFSGCPDCRPEVRGRITKHAEQCPVGLMEAASMSTDLEWFETHPQADYFWRPPTWAEVQLLSFRTAVGPIAGVEGKVLVRHDQNARIRDFQRVRWWCMAPD